MTDATHRRVNASPALAESQSFDPVREKDRALRRESHSLPAPDASG